MKASDYAERYRANPTLEELTAVGLDMLAEIKTLIAARHAKYDSALFPIISEIDDKWHAFLRLVGKEEYTYGFEGILQHKLPEVYIAWREWKLESSKIHIYRRYIFSRN